MKKDNLEKEFEKRSDVSLSFSDIESKINYDQYKNTNKNPNLFLKLGLAFSLVCAITISGVVIFNQNRKVEEIAIANQEDLVVFYERNSSFIDDGFVLEKKLANGKKAKLNANEYTVDSTEFKEGEVGEYYISIYLNENSNINTGYTAEVIDDEIIGVELESFRDVYYLGEEVIVQDITLNKRCASGETREAKITEYTIDTTSFNSNEIGTYTIRVILKSNTDFHLDFEVEVKSIEEVDLNGRYAYVDDYFAVGAPTIYALDIIDEVLYSRYSEIVMGGTIIKEYDGNKIIVRSEGRNQYIVYTPSNRTLVVSGIAGDPDMPCFRLNRTDMIISLTGDSLEDTTKYVAIDGYLSQGTIDYLKWQFGGIFIDETMNEEVTTQTYFTEDSTICVGFKPAIEDEKQYLGIWYDEENHNKVSFEITENEIYSPNAKEYRVQDAGNGIYIIRVENYYYYEYNSANDTMTARYIEDTEYTTTYKRYNSETQALVTINNSRSSSERYVVEKGTSFNPIFIDSASVSWFVMAYSGEAIYEDRAFNSVERYSNYITDIRGTFGTIDRNVKVVNGALKNKEHAYWYQVTENYEQTIVGWVEISGKNIESHDVILTVHMDDETTKTIIWNPANNTIEDNGETFANNPTPLQDSEIVGTYFNEAGDAYFITDKATIYFVFGGVPVTGYTIHYFDMNILSDGSIRLYYYSFDEYFNMSTVEYILTKNEETNLYSFEVNGQVYVQDGSE